MATVVNFIGSGPLSAGDIARSLGVNRKMVDQWDAPGAMPHDFITPGGQKRWYPETVRGALISGIVRAAA